MISGFNYITQQQENKWIFYAAGNSWQVWEKPDGCNMIHIVVIGAGGGGGGAYQRGPTASGGGGGGGASSGISTTMIPAYVIPDKLHIQVGQGGAGGTNLGGGGSLGPTYISLVPDITNTYCNILISNTGTGGGGAGSSVGVVGGLNTSTWSTPFSGWGKYVNILGGQAGGGGRNVDTANFDQTRIVGAGVGGAYAAVSTDVAGKSILSSYKQPSSVVYSIGEPVGVSGGGSGGPNLMSPQPQFFAGAGGAAIRTTNNVNGGNGGIGCGGGGGGVNLLGGSSTGGRGGTGMVIITCW
jgi:hypothetical protein